MSARRGPRFTLTQLFVIAAVGLTLLVGVGFLGFFESSRRSILQRSEVLRNAAAEGVEARVMQHLDHASLALAHVERDIQLLAKPGASALELEPLFLTEVLDDPKVAEVTFTHASKLGFDEGTGDIQVAETDRWQLSVFRASEREGGAVKTRISERDGDSLATSSASS